MASFEELRDTRIAKLSKLKEAGMDPYPAKVPHDHTLLQAKESFKDGKTISVVGRIMAIRGQGAIMFAVVYDGTEKFQLVFKKDVLDLTLFNEAVDIGDFISATGDLFTTQRGEQSLLVSSWVMATKAIAPLPDKWHGLQDTDERYRKRYLDLLMNTELRDLLIKKSKFWDVTRAYLKENGFLEVETPTLEVTTGGAEATPFKTHHNDYDLDVYLRISVGELWQKRLMAAGFPKTFEIGRVYRNEGSSPDHLQEFTGMEFYWAYADYNDGIAFTEEMIKKVAKETFGTLDFSTRGHSFSLGGKWERISYVDIVKEKTGVNVLTATGSEIEEKLKELKVSYEGSNRERLTDTLWKYCRKQIAGPVWLVDVPKLVSPLSKAKKDNPEMTERVQLILAGAEMTNGFSELNDPADQRARFELQQKLIERGDTEAMMPEWEFVDMLEHGMPPAFGFAYGERLFAFLADRPLRELQTFPLMRPKDEHVTKKGPKIAVAVVRSDIETWKKLNASAHLGAALGARLGRSLLLQDTIHTKDKESLHLNIQHAIMIKEATESKALINLANDAKKSGLEVEEFTLQMQETTNDKKVILKTAELNNVDVERLGVLVFGEKETVEKLTENFKLFSN